MVLSSKLLFKFNTILELWLYFLVRKSKLKIHSFSVQLLKIIRVVRVAITRNIVPYLQNEYFFLPFKHKSRFGEKSVPNDQS